MVGEAWTTLMGKGSASKDPNNPQVVFKAGASGFRGVMEITDFAFTTARPSQFPLYGFTLVLTLKLSSRRRHCR